jgi:hypothetical protein
MRIRMNIVIAFAVVCLCATGTSVAAAPKDFAGTWVMRLDERNLFVLTIAVDGSGTMARPAKMSVNRSLFAGLGGGMHRDALMKSTFADQTLKFSVPDPDDPKDEDSYVMTVKGEHAELISGDDPPGSSVPWHFERVPPGAAVSSDWEPNRTYAVGDTDVPCAEMKAMYDEDQRVRMTSTIDWAVVGKSDAARQARTRELLKAGALHTGKDFEEASFIFQHGSTGDDYLEAHVLAMVAVAKGDSGAAWIAAATLDRYLEKVGQKQIMGTQYSNQNSGPWTQEPYDRDLISDALRQQFGVPLQAGQTEQLKSLNERK